MAGALLLLIPAASTGCGDVVERIDTANRAAVAYFKQANEDTEIIIMPDGRRFKRHVLADLANKLGETQGARVFAKSTGISEADSLELFRRMKIGPAAGAVATWVLVLLGIIKVTAVGIAYAGGKKRQRTQDEPHLNSLRAVLEDRKLRIKELQDFKSEVFGRVENHPDSDKPLSVKELTEISERCRA